MFLEKLIARPNLFNLNERKALVTHVAKRIFKKLIKKDVWCSFIFHFMTVHVYFNEKLFFFLNANKVGKGLALIYTTIHTAGRTLVIPLSLIFHLKDF